MEETRFPRDPKDPAQGSSPHKETAGAGGDDVKIYSSDSGHQLGPQPEAGEGDHGGHPGGHHGRLAAVDARCREQLAERPWTVLGVATLAAGALGAVAGYCCGKRHGSLF